jgi:hypothetical protein
MNLCSKFGVDRGVRLPLLSLSFERWLLVLLLEEIGVLLDPLGLFDGFWIWIPYSSETVSEIISCWFSGTAGDGSSYGSRRLVPIISRWPLEELYFSFAFSGTSYESSSFLSPLLNVLLEPDYMALLELVKLFGCTTLPLWAGLLKSRMRPLLGILRSSYP